MFTVSFQFFIRKLCAGFRIACTVRPFSIVILIIFLRTQRTNHADETISCNTKTNKSNSRFSPRLLDVLAVQSSTVIHIIISYLSFACPFKYSFIWISMEPHSLFPSMVEFFFFSVRFWWLSSAIKAFLFASIAKVKTHTFFVSVGREAHNAAVGSISIEIHGTKAHILWNEWTLPNAQNGNATIFSPRASADHLPHNSWVAFIWTWFIAFIAHCSNQRKHFRLLLPAMF